MEMLFATPVEKLYDNLASRIPVFLVGREAATVTVEGAKKRRQIRARIHEDQATRAALKYVQKVARRLITSRRLEKQVQVSADSGLEELTQEEVVLVLVLVLVLRAEV